MTITKLRVFMVNGCMIDIDVANADPLAKMAADAETAGHLLLGEMVYIPFHNILFMAVDTPNQPPPFTVVKGGLH